MANVISTWWSDYKAWRRGLRRIAPRGSRGRIYEPREPTPHKSSVKITAKVTRANGDIEIYNLTEGT